MISKKMDVFEIYAWIHTSQQSLKIPSVLFFEEFSLFLSNIQALVLSCLLGTFECFTGAAMSLEKLKQ